MPTLRIALFVVVVAAVLFALLRLESAVTPAAAMSHPRQVLIIRHAEKPPEELLRVELNERGNERASALPKLFERFAKPDFIFAGGNTKKSHRSVLTAAPLAAGLGLKVNAEYQKDNFAALAEELQRNAGYAGKTVLVVWGHSTIPPFARALGAEGVPEHWKDEVFDRVWVLTWDDAGKVSFRDEPQKLLPGDSE